MVLRIMVKLTNRTIDVYKINRELCLKYSFMMSIKMTRHFEAFLGILTHLKRQ
jgi:hypothetical protein